MTVVGCEAMFGDSADARLYKSLPSGRPKWMRGTSDKVRTRLDGGRYVRHVGWRLEPGNRRFTTCIKTETIITEWRH